MHETIPIVLASSNEYVKAVATVIVSILINSNKDINYEFNILTTSITKDNQNKLSKIKDKFNNSDIKFIDISKYSSTSDLNSFLDKNDTENYFTIENFFRLYIHQIFPLYEKIIYLDSDLLILQDLNFLFSEDISNYYAGVVEDFYIKLLSKDSQIDKKKIEKTGYKDFETYLKEKLQMKNFKYFNSGVMLLNLKKIREDNIINKCWELLIRKSPFLFLDQDVLNSTLESNVKYLDYKWNVSKNYKFFSRSVNDKQKSLMLMQAGNNPGIIHFTGINKPWETCENFNENYNLFFDWWKYFSQTPFWTKEEHAKLVDITKKRATQRPND